MSDTETYYKKSDRDNAQPFELLMRWGMRDERLIDLIGFNAMKYNFQFLKDFNGIKAGEYYEKRHLGILKYYFVMEHNKTFSDQLLIQYMEVISFNKIIHPIKDYLNGLKWDGICRLDSWLHLYIGCTLTPYTSALGRIVLCAAVARVFDPGVKFDLMMILEGAQGTLKSSILEILAGEWFLSMTLEGDEKSNIEKMMGSWIIEIADLGGFKRAEIEWLRAFITRRVDKCRLPYAHTAQEFPRQSIFIGTTNPSADNEYLKDDTGNRRFCPITIGKLNLIGFKDVRDQLWAEAVLRYRQGEKLYMEGHALELAQMAQKEREESDIWQPRIRAFVMTKEEVTMPDILEHLEIRLNQASHLDKIRIGRVMKKLGWERKQKSTGDWYYYDPNFKGVVKEAEQITAWDE